jgi:transposase-like protein
MRRRKWRPEWKALIVVEELKGRPIGELCAEHEISQAQYYQWRDLFLANAARAFEPPSPASAARGSLAGAIRYNLSRLPALCRFAHNGRLELPNNAAERAIRPLALGRKNYLFAGSDAALVEPRFSTRSSRPRP